MVGAFWAVSFLLVITPGADWAYVISAGLRARRLVVPAVLGLALGALLATAAVAAGVGALVAREPLVLTVLTVVGAAYLLWMGLGMWRSAAASHGVEPVSAPSSAPEHRTTLEETLPATVAPPILPEARWRWAIKGAGVSSLNPKLVLLLLALLPQFVRPASAWPVGAQILALGAVHAASCCLVYFGVGVASQRVLGGRPAAARLVTRTSGALMVLIAGLLLAEQLWLIR